MAPCRRVLRLYLLAERRVDPIRWPFCDRLAARRTVWGRAPDWRVLYEVDDLSEAMRMCAADLDQLDPRWLEILDFQAQTTPGPRDAGSG